MQSLLNSSKKMIALLGISFSLIIVGMAAAAVAIGGDAAFAPSSEASQSSSSEASSGGQEAGDRNPIGNLALGGDDQAAGTVPVVFNKPDEMRGVVLKPGEDYLTGAGSDEAAVKAEIDKALSRLEELEMNTVILQTTGEKGVAYVTDALPQLAQGFDPLAYAISAAKEKGMYVYCIYNALTVYDGQTLSTAPYIDAKVLDFVRTGVADFVSRYQPDGLILDDYYSIPAQDSYASYLKYGGGMGYEAYMQSVSRVVVTSVGKVLDEKVPGMQLGLLTGPQWATQQEDERGSATAAPFSALTDGNADLVAFVEDKLVDFVMVEAYGSLTDTAIPFATVVGWWGSLLSENGLPLYVLQASDRICTQNPGWSSPDEITKQVIEARGITGYCGSAFNSFSRLSADPEGAATKLARYYKGEINPEYMLRELTMSKPEQTTFTTYEPTVTFMGASDPENKLTLNGQDVQRDDNGFFTLSADLKAGLNTFTFAHKEKTITYKITRNVQIIDSVSPTGNITVDGGMKITVSVQAYVGSKVTASLNGKTISLSESDEEDDSTDKNSSYTKYTGTFTAPAATSSVQNLGNIAFAATYQGMSTTKNGAVVKVNKKAVIGDGEPVKVTASQAETFPSSSINDLSSPDCFPLPKGALDYTLGDEIIYQEGNYTYRYYMLESGQRVYAKDVSSTSSMAEENQIKGFTVTSTKTYTDVILTMTQPVSYTASYSSSGMSFEFHYTDSVPKDLKLTKNPLFSSASWKGTELTLKFKESNGMVGYTASFDGSNLVLRFNNVPASLSDARIVVDPGHGGTDPGALGFNKYYPESAINSAIADKLADVLRDSYGASVKLINTKGSAKVELDDRIAQAQSYNPQLFISIHCNSALSSSGKGSETYYFYPFSKGLAQTTNSALYSAMGTGNRGAKYGLYRVTRTSHYASTLVECGFLTNETDYNKLLSASVQNSIAKKLASAIDSYFNDLYSGSFTPGTESVGTAAETGVTQVTLNKTELALAVGEKATLTATVEPENAADKGLKWSSSDSKVAAVSASGEVTAVAPGTATITVTTEEGGKTATCKVTVAEAGSVAGVVLDKTQLTMTPGQEVTLKATVEPESAKNKNVSWSSDDDSVAKVSAGGKITAVRPGTAVITVTTEEGGKTASCKVTVSRENIPVTGITVEPGEKTLKVGETFTLTARLAPENATDNGVEWSSDQPKIASVSASGKITARAPGTAVITATSIDGGKTASCKVTVSEAGISVTGVAVEPSSASLKVGETISLTARITPDNATDHDVSWESDKPEVASVNAAGKVTARGEGTAVITVTTADGGKKAQCTIQVSAASIPVSGVKVDPDKATLEVGQTLSLDAQISPENATDHVVSWHSDKPEIAEVSASGKVTAKAPGTAVITVTTADGKKTASCIITVSAASSESSSSSSSSSESSSGSSTESSQGSSSESSSSSTSSSSSSSAQSSSQSSTSSPGSSTVSSAAPMNSFSRASTPAIQSLSLTSGILQTIQYHPFFRLFPGERMVSGRRYAL